MRRTTIQLLVLIGVPGLFAVAICWGLGFYCECFGPAFFMLAAFVLVSVFPRLRTRMLVLAAIIGLIVSVILHVLASRTVIIENRSGNPIDWVHVWLPNEIYEGWNWPDGFSQRFSYEALIYQGVGLEGRLRDGAELAGDWGTFPYGESPHTLWILIGPDGKCRYATSPPPRPAARLK